MLLTKDISSPKRVYIELPEWPAPSWLDSSIGGALHRYRRGHGFESRSSLNFFRLNFRNCLSCIYNCDDLSLIHYFFRISNIWIFIYSLLRHLCLSSIVYNANMMTLETTNSDSKAVDKLDLNRFIRNSNQLLVQLQWLVMVLQAEPLKYLKTKEGEIKMS